jgi:ubiquinone biosynthesis monooxygenase Coq7
MREDELRHKNNALTAGGANFPAPVKSLMHKVSSLMTKSTYWI